MKYVDIILKYIYGDLSDSEILTFEKDLGQNLNMQSEFKQVKLIYDKLTEELKIKHTESEKREKIIRDIIVEHDLELYRAPVVESDEIEFISKLRAHSESVKKETVQRRVSLFMSPVFYLAMAASVAFLLILLIPKATPEQLFAQYYKPAADEILILLSESSRGEVQSGIILYKKGLYKQTIAHFKPFIQEEDTDPFIRLFYALATIEENGPYELTPLLKLESIDMDVEIDLAITWYYSLYLIHQKETAEAQKYLEILSDEENPYYKKAKRLLRKID